MKLDEKSKRHDRFYQRARKESFAARSVYKLEEIDRRWRVLRAGARVCDLGCRPGSWLQYASKAVGPEGALVGVDRTPLEIHIPHARVIVGDIFTIEPAALLGDLEAFDVMLSDMAPDTTGVRSLDQARCEGLFERALDLATRTLAPGGHFIGKLFQGPDWQRLVAEVRRRFLHVKTVKPEGTRKESIEQYVVGLGFRG